MSDFHQSLSLQQLQIDRQLREVAVCATALSQDKGRLEEVLFLLDAMPTIALEST